MIITIITDARSLVVQTAASCRRVHHPKLFFFSCPLIARGKRRVIACTYTTHYKRTKRLLTLSANVYTYIYVLLSSPFNDTHYIVIIIIINIFVRVNGSTAEIVYNSCGGSQWLQRSDVEIRTMVCYESFNIEMYSGRNILRRTRESCID